MKDNHLVEITLPVKGVEKRYRVLNACLTPLHQACLDGNLPAVKLLVEYGADINKQDEDTWTPLHAACQEGHLDIVKWLIEQGADTNIYTDEGERPIDLVDSNDFALISFLLSHKLETSPANQSDSDNEDKPPCST